MNNLQPKQFVRFATIDRPTARIVVAFLVEVQGFETVVVSEPRIVKIVPKAVTPALRGAVRSQDYFFLPGFIQNKKSTGLKISPFVSAIFGSTNSDFIAGLAPQPPTTT